MEYLLHYVWQHRMNAQPLFTTDGRPVLHTFSLGQFYIGGVYQYDATDSDKLTEVIRQVSRGMKQKGWFGKLH